MRSMPIIHRGLGWSSPSAEHAGTAPRRRRSAARTARRGPAPVLALDDRDGERADATAKSAGAEQVGPQRARLADLDQRQRAPAARPDEPDRARSRGTPGASRPATSRPPERRAGRRGGSAGRGPDADRGRRARWASNSGSISPSDVGSISAAPTPGSTRAATSNSTDGAARTGGAGEDEDAEAGEEHALAPEGVRPAPGGHEQRGEDDRVGVQDPGQRRQRGAGEVPLDLREGDVDDEQVEARHEDPDARR